MSRNILSKSLGKLQHYVEQEDFKGYDPYDVLFSSYDLEKLPQKLTYILTQLHKRNPVDLRPLLGIKKHYVPKGMGLFLQAYARLYRLNRSTDLKSRMTFIFDWLIENASSGYSGYCWGLPFAYSNRLNYLPAKSPSIVVTSIVHAGIYEYYMITKDKRAIEILRSACDFVLKDLVKTNGDSGVCFSYTTVEQDLCINANALGGQMLVRTFALTGESELQQEAKAIFDFTVNLIQQDGHWNYRINPDGSQMVQTDFHQGFILEAINDYICYSGDKEPRYREALIRGAEFYFRRQFLMSGRAMGRLPLCWPVDIHSQAQGIITFSRLANLSPEYLPFARKIALWTIENMQDEEGYFYYQLGKFYNNRIPYIRWGQAWMMNALSCLLSNLPNG